MFYLLLPVAFLLITTALNEPLNLARSILLILVVTITTIANPEILKAKSKYMYLLLILPGIYVISALANKQNPTLALLGNYNRNFGIFTLIAVGLLVLITSNLKMKTSSFMNYGVWPVTVLAVAYSYVQSFDVDPLVWAETDRTVLTMGNSNYAASFLGMLITVPLYGFLAYSSKLIKVLMVPLIWLINNAGLNSQAYQYRVIAVVSVTTFLIAHFWDKIISFPKLLTGSFFTAITSAGVFFVLSNKTELISRTNFEDRISQQKMGLSLFLDNPFFGVGIEQMWRYMPLYLKPADIEKYGSLVVPDKTHNTFIDHLANGGVFAALTYVSFMIFSLMVAFQLQRKSKNKVDRPLISLLVSIWVAYVAQQFVSTDQVFLMILPFMAFGLICKLYFVQPEATTNKNRKSENLATTTLPKSLISFFLIAVIIIGGRAIYYDSQVKKILSREIMNGDIALSTIKSFPNPKSAEQIIVDALSNLQNCNFVNVASDELLKVDNRSAQAWYFKTLCIDATGDRKTALSYIEKALYFQPINTIYLEAKFKLMVSTGDIMGATAVLEKMKSINPNLPNLAELQKLLEVPATK
jgi:O-antigen ligase